MRNLHNLLLGREHCIRPHALEFLAHATFPVRPGDGNAQDTPPSNPVAANECRLAGRFLFRPTTVHLVPFLLGHGWHEPPLSRGHQSQRVGTDSCVCNRGRSRGLASARARCWVCGFRRRPRTPRVGHCHLGPTEMEKLFHVLALQGRNGARFPVLSQVLRWAIPVQRRLQSLQGGGSNQHRPTPCAAAERSAKYLISARLPLP